MREVFLFAYRMECISLLLRPDELKDTPSQMVIYPTGFSNLAG